MKAQGIYLSWIVVKDIEAAVKFYTEVVGLELQEYAKEFGWAELSGPGGSILGLAQENAEYNAVAGSNAVITVTVDDISVARERFKKRGVQLVGEVIEVPGH